MSTKRTHDTTKEHHGRIGLALGGGAARGWSHIGVLQALSEAGIRPDVISGTSVGALVGAIYASGGMEAVLELAKDRDRYRLASFLEMGVPRSGLTEGRKVEEIFGRYLKHENIEDFPIPFCAVATDINTGAEVELTSGNAVDAIRASASVPGLFTPARIGDHVLVDGGLVDPVPVGPARHLGADQVIAVDITRFILDDGLYPQPAAADPDEPRRHLPGILRRLPELKLPEIELPWIKGDDDRVPNLIDVLTATVAITEITVTGMRMEKDPPEILVCPKVGHIRFLDFTHAEECIEAGWRATREALLRAGMAPGAPVGAAGA